MRPRIARVRFNKNSADPPRRAVHLHVPFALQRGFPKNFSPLRTSRHRTWCGRHSTRRPNRTTIVCSARPGPQPEERHRVRLVWLHLEPLIQTLGIEELVIIYGLLANPSPSELQKGPLHARSRRSNSDTQRSMAASVAGQEPPPRWRKLQQNVPGRTSTCELKPAANTVVSNRL